MNIFWMMGFAFVYILIGYVVTVLLEECGGDDIKVEKWTFMLAWPLCIMVSFVVAVVVFFEWFVEKTTGGK